MIRSLIARRACAALLAGLTVLLSGCLGGGGNSGGNAQLRVLNLTTDLTSIDVSLSGSKAYTSAAQQTLTSYSSQTAQSYTVSITSAGSVTSLFSGTYSLAKDLHYTGVVWGTADSLNFATLPEDQNDSLAAGTTEVRVYNATASAGAFDVYLTPVAQNVSDLSGVTPTRSSVGSRALSGYALLSTGSYRLRVTAAGNPEDVRLDVPSLTLGDTQYATVIITSGTGNSLVNATVLVQQNSTLTAFNNGNARIRVVASVQINSDNVTRSLIGVSVDGTTLASGTLRSPSVGPYTTVASGNRTVAVSLNGTVYSTTTQSIAAGSDYTLMAYGSQASPQVVLIPDDNSVPATGKVQLRLINGDDTVGLATLLVDNGNLSINSIDAGSASDYNLYTATTGTTSQIPSRLEVFSGNAPDVALYTNPSQTLLSQGVYTVFLLRGGLSSGSPAPTGLLRKDR